MNILALNILFSTTFVLLYVAVCIRLKSFINIFTPYFLITLASRYLLDNLYFFFTEINPDLLTYLIVYSYSLLDFSSLLIGFWIAGSSIINIKLFNMRSPLSNRAHWLTLALSSALYLPIVANNIDLITNPRDIYTATRTGAGPLFFGSLILAYVSYALYLFSERQKSWTTWVYHILLIGSLLLHGNKSPLVVLFFMNIIYASAIKRKLYTAIQAVKTGVLITVLIIGLFVISLSENMKQNFLLGVASYSDFNRNFALVVEDPPPIKLGMLTLEGQIWPLIPRSLYPNKPKNFGTFYLAEHYYPEWFDADAGAPAFGFGVTYADFHQWAILYILFTSLGVGILLRLYFNRLRAHHSPGDFIMVVFLSGTPLIELGAGYQFIPHLILSIIVMLSLKTRFLPHRSNTNFVTINTTTDHTSAPLS